MSIWVWEPCLIRPETGGNESPNMGKVGITGMFRKLEPGETGYYIEPVPNTQLGQERKSIPGKASSHENWLKGE